MIPLTSVHQSHLCKLSPIGHLGINSYSKKDRERKWTYGWPTSNNCNPQQTSVEKVVGLFYLPPALVPPNPFCWPAAHLEVLRGQHSFPLWKKKSTQTIKTIFFILGILHIQNDCMSGFSTYLTNAALINIKCITQYMSFGHNWTDSLTYISSVRSLIFSLLAYVEVNSLLWLTAGLAGGENGRRPLVLKGGNQVVIITDFWSQ